MNIILDGPDAVGKTQIATTTAQKLNIQSKHLDHSYASQYLSLLSQNDNCVYDRFHISEVVFSNIYNRNPKMQFDEVMQINRKIKENNDIFILLFSSDLDIIRGRLKERGEFNELNEVEDQYNEFLKWIYIENAYFDEYQNYTVIDIADPKGYEKLNSWLNWRLS